MTASIIETGRTALRPLSASDVDLMVDLVGDPQVMRYLTNGKQEGKRMSHTTKAPCSAQGCDRFLVTSSDYLNPCDRKFATWHHGCCAASVDINRLRGTGMSIARVRAGNVRKATTKSRVAICVLYRYHTDTCGRHQRVN